MAPLFSKVDLNKLWHDVQNEEALISAGICCQLLIIIENLTLTTITVFIHW